ncbi:MAG: hypothetical protein MUO63_22745 [Desulfobulbaceae bacterium]|nr:hypothetical protein [Desulfobulbaceae bacterium]
MIKKIFSLVVLCLWSSLAFAENVSLSVTERSGVGRAAAPVTYGVPFSMQDNLLSTASLGVTGKDAQFRVLSRYNGTPDDTTKPIRMVLVDFQTDINANETRQFTLSTAETGPVTGPNLAADSAGFVEINTGAGLFRISKTQGNVFDQVSVGGTSLVSAPSSDGFTIVFDGTEYSSVNKAPSSVVIEENGPLRCVVRAEGEFADQAGTVLKPPTTRVGTVPDSPLRYTIRYFAYKYKSYLKLQATLRNENKGWTYEESAPVHNIRISEAYLKTTLAGLGAGKTIAFNGYTENFTSGNYSILQREISDGSLPAYNWRYEITKGGAAVATGKKYDSYVDLRDSAKGLMVADRWFWQNQPSEVTVNDNEVRMNLWPAIPGQTHRILGGIWKTHEILYYFHGTDTTFADEVAHIKKRLIARCTDEYYAKTDFFPFIAPSTVRSDYTFPAGEKLQVALDQHSNSHRAKFDKTFIENKWAPNTVFDVRDGRKVQLTASPLQYATWYGWLEFGGMPRAEGFGYSNQHYDWSYLALLGFLRFSDYNMFDIAEEFLRHKADILVIHDPDAKVTDGLDYEYHGGQRYEEDALFSYHEDYGPYNTAPRKASHFWTAGLTLQYLLTGEMTYYDTVIQSFEHIVRVWDSGPMNNVETRNSNRGIEALCHGYALTGKIEYLNTAYAMLKNNLLVREGGATANDGVSGWLHSDVSYPDGVWIGYDAIQQEPLIKLYYALTGAGETAKAQDVRNFLFRWGNWARNTYFTVLPSGQYKDNMTQYQPYMTYQGWTKSGGYYGNPDGEYTETYADLFAFLYREVPQAEKEGWINMARSVFKDYQIYQNIGTWTANSFLGGLGFGASGLPENISSGNWKIAKAITKPIFYIRTEWLINNSPEIINIRME